MKDIIVRIWDRFLGDNSKEANLAKEAATEIARLRNRALVEVEGLHPDTQKLVIDFSQALAEKLKKAQDKYGYENGWKDPAWMEQCRKELLHHLTKGDPRDVAAYCAFLWYHNESTIGE